MIRQIIQHEGDVPLAVSVQPSDRRQTHMYATVIDMGVKGDKLPGISCNEDHKLGEHLNGPRLFIRRLDDQDGWSIVIHPDNGDPTHRVEILDSPDVPPHARVTVEPEE